MLARVLLVRAEDSRLSLRQPRSPAKAENAPQRRLPGDREVDALGDVLRRTLELIEQGGARWARALRQGQQRRLTPSGPGRS